MKHLSAGTYADSCSFEADRNFNRYLFVVLHFQKVNVQQAVIHGMKLQFLHDSAARSAVNVNVHQVYIRRVN